MLQFNEALHLAWYDPVRLFDNSAGTYFLGHPVISQLVLWRITQVIKCTDT